MRVLVTGATGYLGWRTATLLGGRGHDVVTLTRPGSRARAASSDLRVDHVVDAGDPAARDLVAGCDAVLHFAGRPRSRASARGPRDRGARERRHDRQPARGAAPRTTRCSSCRRPRARGSTRRPTPTASPSASARRPAGCTARAPSALRLTSVFGPGQVAWEGATGAIAAFAARAIDGRPITIPGDPSRTRDFLYVDDLVDGIERLVVDGRPRRSCGRAAASPRRCWRRRRSRSRRRARTSRSSCRAASCPPGEGDSYALPPSDARLALTPRPLDQAVTTYVDWLRLHPAAQGRSRG